MADGSSSTKKHEPLTAPSGRGEGERVQHRHPTWIDHSTYEEIRQRVARPIPATIDEFPDVLVQARDDVRTLLAAYDALVAERADLATEAQYLVTMLSCPYYRGTGSCESGCYSEPACQTNGPWDNEVLTLLRRIADGITPQKEEG